MIPPVYVWRCPHIDHEIDCRLSISRGESGASLAPPPLQIPPSLPRRAATQCNLCFILLHLLRSVLRLLRFAHVVDFDSDALSPRAADADPPWNSSFIENIGDVSSSSSLSSSSPSADSPISRGRPVASDGAGEAPGASRPAAAPASSSLSDNAILRKRPAAPDSASEDVRASRHAPALSSSSLRASSAYSLGLLPSIVSTPPTTRRRRGRGCRRGGRTPP